MKRAIGIFGCLFFYSIAGYCQVNQQNFNTAAEVHISGIYFNRMAIDVAYFPAFILVPQIGASLNRNISGNFSTEIACHTYLMNDTRTELQGNHTIWPGQITSRDYFSFLDLVGQYTSTRKKHQLYAGIGVSYAFGAVSYIAQTRQLHGYDIISTWGSRYDKNAGGIAMIGYNRLSHNKRMNVGLGTTFRYYGKDFQQYELNINIGYHFNLFKQKKADN